MMRVRTYLAPSPIHGTGLFAADPVRAGTVVWSLGPEDLVFPTWNMRYIGEPVKSHFMRFAYNNTPHTDEYVLCADNGKFFNHSESPNTHERYDEDPDYGVDVASRDIAAGEELTTDYRGFGPGACRSFLD